MNIHLSDLKIEAFEVPGLLACSIVAREARLSCVVLVPHCPSQEMPFNWKLRLPGLRRILRVSATLSMPAFIALRIWWPQTIGSYFFRKMEPLFALYMGFISP